MRKSIKTTEFWIGLITAVLMAVFPDFPKESGLAVLSWIVMRSGQKYFGIEDKDGKRAWQTSEMWVSIGYAAARYFLPDLPEGLLWSVMGWAGLRTGVKLVTPTTTATPTTPTAPTAPTDDPGSTIAPKE